MADDFWDSIFARDTFAQPSFEIETLPDGTRRPIQRNRSLFGHSHTVTGRIEPHRMPIQTYRDVERSTEPMWREARFIADEEMPRDTVIAVDSRGGQPTTITWPRWEQYSYEWPPQPPLGAPTLNAIRAEMQRTLDATGSNYMDSIVNEPLPSVSEAPPPAVFPEPPETEVEMPQFDEDDMSLLARIGRLNMNRADRIAHINRVGEGNSPNCVRTPLYSRLTSKQVRQTRGWF